MSDISEKKEPTMDFQVDEIFFSENSLFELATLSIPLQFVRLANNSAKYHKSKVL